MSGKICAALAPKVISAATSTGYVTVLSTTGLYPKGIIYLKNAGQADIECTVTEIVSGTVFGVRINYSVAVGQPGYLNGPNYGRSDISAYNGGTATWPEQFIFNPNDLPLS